MISSMYPERGESRSPEDSLGAGVFFFVSKKVPDQSDSYLELQTLYRH